MAHFLHHLFLHLWEPLLRLSGDFRELLINVKSVSAVLFSSKINKLKKQI